MKLEIMSEYTKKTENGKYFYSSGHGMRVRDQQPTTLAANRIDSALFIHGINGRTNRGCRTRHRFVVSSCGKISAVELCPYGCSVKNIICNDTVSGFYDAKTNTAQWPALGASRTKVSPTEIVSASCQTLLPMSIQRSVSEPSTSETSSDTSPPSGK